MTVYDLSGNPLPELDQMTAEPTQAPDTEPTKRRKRRTKAEIAADQTSDRAPAIGGTASSGKLKKDLDLIKRTFDTLFTGAGSLLIPIEPFDGNVLVYNGPAVVDALVDVASTDARLREALVNFCSATGYTKLAYAIMGLILPILAHHQVAPAMFIYMAPEKAIDVEMAQRAARAEAAEQRKKVHSANGAN